VDPAESDVRPGPSLMETAAEVDPESFLRRVPLGPWMLVVAVGLVLIQVLWATWLGWRRRHASEEMETGIQDVEQMSAEVARVG
jgi:hypothetical protein